MSLTSCLEEMSEGREKRLSESGGAKVEGKQCCLHRIIDSITALPLHLNVLLNSFCFFKNCECIFIVSVNFCREVKQNMKM